MHHDVGLHNLDSADPGGCMIRFLIHIVLWFVVVLPAAAENIAVPQVPSSEAIPRWTVQAGAGSSRAWNLVGISYDVVAVKHVSAYVSAGLGTILGGAGVAYFSNRQGNGLVVSGNAGVVGAHVNAGYQFRLGNKGYLVGGASYGYFFLQYKGAMPFVGYEYRF
jgi:hypothetical protein